MTPEVDQFDVAGAGCASIDDSFYVDASPTDDKGRILARERQPGGNIATALVAAAELGARVGFVGRLSDRDEGAVVRADFAAHGVDLQFTVPDPQAGPIRATIVVYQDGERFIAYDDVTTIGLSPGDDVTALRQARIVLLDKYALAPAVAALRAAGSEAMIVADVEAEVDRGSLERVQHLVLPMAAARQLSGETDPAAIVNVLWSDRRAAVVVTDGGHGVWFRDLTGPNCQHHPAFEVPVVDTTGCGDVFHGAYAVALARGFDISECVRFAAAAGAICATGRGGRGRLPTEETISQILRGELNPLGTDLQSG
ncbi:MAG: PfkB family carbohydrate kinase [Propionibacteriaceae bacterium]